MRKELTIKTDGTSQGTKIFLGRRQIFIQYLDFRADIKNQLVEANFRFSFWNEDEEENFVPEFYEELLSKKPKLTFIGRTR